MVTGDATGLTSVVMSYTQRQQICNKKTRTHSGLSLNKGLFNNNKNSCILSRLKILYLACSRVTNSQYCLICHLKNLPYYRKYMLHEIKALEIKVTYIDVNLIENNFQIKEIKAKKRVTFQK